MDLMAFQKLRSGLKQNVTPASGVVLEAAELRLRTLLASCGMFSHVEVDRTSDPDRLLIAMVEYNPELSEAEVLGFLKGAWSAELRYLGWDAAAFIVEDEHVELQAATMHGDASHYVSMHLVAEKAAVSAAVEPSDIPAQRRTDPVGHGGFLRRRKKLARV
jgi:hypothetical protein